eukprot:6190737-Pleurochrysis_carterae.AAC.1
MTIRWQKTHAFVNMTDPFSECSRFIRRAAKAAPRIAPATPARMPVRTTCADVIGAVALCLVRSSSSRRPYPSLSIGAASSRQADTQLISESTAEVPGGGASCGVSAGGGEVEGGGEGAYAAVGTQLEPST